MKILRWAFIIWSVCACLVVIAGILANKATTETNLFCAYGRVFVEFEEHGKRWGTIMLDYNGKPVPCGEDNDIKIGTTI
jgi:hypothetical protein